MPKSKSIPISLFCLLSLSTPALAADKGPFLVHTDEAQQVQVIDSGVAALELRLEMVERAKTRIDVEYFIYNTDRAGRIFTQALLKKKREIPSIQIRILVDAAPMVLKLDSFYVAELKKHGIEVRYYNPSSILDIVKTQYRDHRKLLVIDGVEGITGGRNIGDEYFDLNPKFNFRDRDIWIRGSLAAEMEKTFAAYWKSNFVAKPAAPLDPQLFTQVAYDESVRQVADFIHENADDRAIRANVSRLATAPLANPSSIGSCGSSEFVTDEPGFLLGNNNANPKRHVNDVMYSRFDGLKNGDHLYVESPYFILEKDGDDAIRELRAKNVKTTLLTNSLTSSDAVYVAANFLPRVETYAHEGIGNIYVYRGKAARDTLYVRDRKGKKLAENAAWGIHSKTIVFDQDSFSIGSFNIDPRSAHLNSEVVLICDQSPALANFVRSSIQSRLNDSQMLGPNGQPADGTTLDGVSPLKELLFLFSVLPSNVVEFLL